MIAAGGVARQYTPGGDNTLGEPLGLAAAAASGQPYAVQLRSGLVGLDVDGCPEAAELLTQAAETAGVVPPVASRPGGQRSGHVHLLANVGPAAAAAFAPVVADIVEALRVQYGTKVDVRRGGQPNAWLRPPGSPHRTGGRGQPPDGWTTDQLAAALARKAADPHSVARLLAVLLVRLGLQNRWAARLAVAAYPPSQPGQSPQDRYQQALRTGPAARGLDPSDPTSAEMASLRAVTAGLDAGLDRDTIAADLLGSPAGTKARTRASGRARACPHRWARHEIDRLARKHTSRRRSRDPQPQLDDGEQTWRDKIAAARRNAAAAEGFGRRTDRIRAVACALLNRAERLPADQRGQQVVVEASWRSLGTEIGRHHSTAQAAVADLSELEVIADVQVGDPATARPSQLTLDLSHRLFSGPQQQIRQGALHAPLRGVGHGSDPLSDFRLNSLDRHDAWRLVALSGERIEAALGRARPVWWRLVAVGHEDVEQLAAALGLREPTVRRYVQRLAAAGLVVEHPAGGWCPAPGGPGPQLDHYADTHGTTGAGLVAALQGAAATAQARMCSRSEAGTTAAAEPGPLPPPPDQPPVPADHEPAAVPAGGDRWADTVGQLALDLPDPEPVAAGDPHAGGL